MKIVYNSILPLGGYKAMTIGPWIFCHHGAELSEVDVNHEGIHWEQEKELLVIPFYLLYVLLFVWELVRCMFDTERAKAPDGYRRRSLWTRAYRSVAFEREAYAHEEDMEYIGRRRHYACFRPSKEQ